LSPQKIRGFLILPSIGSEEANPAWAHFDPISGANAFGRRGEEDLFWALSPGDPKLTR
jgi:hypothetical protein